MASRSRTPNTPFIPPLYTPNESPPPVIPSAPRTPNSSYGGAPLPPQGHYVYPTSAYYASPYIPTTGFIPPGLELSDSSSPPVIPGSTPISGLPQGGPPIVSQDYTGYPGGGPPLSPPASAHSSMFAAFGSHTPASAPPHFSNFPSTPWAAPTAIPPSWGMHPSAAWGPPPPGVMSSPYGPPPPGTSPWPMAHQTFTPAPGLGIHLPPSGPAQAQGPPPGAWGQPTQRHSGFYGPQPPHSGSRFADPAAAWFQAQQNPYFGMPPSMQMGPPPPTREPPGQQNADRMPPFTPGPNYGPVLDPFIIRALQVEVRLNPLLSSPGDDPAIHPHLKWNMLFPTSTIQRSDDKSDVSWMNGREAPATFPRVSSLHLVSENFAWMFTVRESLEDRGVTCGDVIETIGKELSKLTTSADFNRLSPAEQAQVSMFYHHNRSRSPGVPGGNLGKGVRRLDYLRKNINFAGIEVNERAVWKLLGGNFPCTFVLKSEALSRREAEEQDQNRLRPSSSQGARSRSRAGSMRISVQSPSDRDDGSGPDND